MYRNIGVVKNNRWGEDEINQEASLLDKKDQQIRRLQTEIQQEKRRADNAIKMLQSYKSLQSKSEESHQNIRNQISKRLRAEEEVKRLKERNKQLEEGITEYLQVLQQRFKDLNEAENNLPKSSKLFEEN